MRTLYCTSFFDCPPYRPPLYRGETTWKCTYNAMEKMERNLLLGLASLRYETPKALSELTVV